MPHPINSGVGDAPHATHIPAAQLTSSFSAAARLTTTILILSLAACSGETVAPAVATSIAANSSATVSAIAGAVVSPAPSVLVKDQRGSPMSGVPVTFTVTAGGGTVTSGAATTNSDGIATAGWTLGTVAGANTLTASSGSLGLVTFVATGTAGPPAAVVKKAGDAQTAPVTTSLTIAPAVTVVDVNGNGISGAAVVFSVAGGGGSVTGATQTTGTTGVAAVGAWTLGNAVGTNTLTATSGSLAPVTFTATAAPGAAASLTKVAGDNQVGTAGVVVPVAPSVVVRDAGGNLTSGAVVNFAVATGGGSVVGATNTNVTSNASGVATVGNWILGPTPGLNTLTVSTPGAPPVTFSSSGDVNACPTPPTHTLGTTTTGALETTDCKFPDASFVDFYTTTVGGADAFLFKQSAAFDAYLVLGAADGTPIAENDDESNTSTNSAIKALLPPGTYLLGPGSFIAGVTGQYTLSSGTTSADAGACEEVFIVRGVTTTQNIQTTDCRWTNAPIYADGYTIFLKAGQTVTASMSSATVDSFLELYNFTGALLASNDNKDTSGTKDAQLTYTATTTAYYFVIARTAVTAQVGGYTLTIQ